MLYFRIACTILLMISASHLIGHFFLIPHLQLTNNFTGQLPANETEKNLFSLMNNYHRSIGGKEVSMMDIQIGLSLCYFLFFCWTGVLNFLLGKGLVRNKRLLSQICLVNAVMLLTGAIISFVYFFWLPLVSFTLAMIFFVLAAFKLRREF
jgi:hypothetical protein